MDIVYTGEEQFLKTKQKFGETLVLFEKQKDGKFVAKNVPERIARNIIINPLYHVAGPEKVEPHEFKAEPNPEKLTLRPKVTQLPVRQKHVSHAPKAK